MFPVRKFIHSATIWLAFLLFVNACNREQPSHFTDDQGATADMAKEDAGQAPAPAQAAGESNTETDIFTSMAARSGDIDSLKHFIRTADIRFRVKNVPEATLRIEDIAAQFGGFVVKSDLRTQVESRQPEPVSVDSALETSVFSVHNFLIVRVPYKQLDTTLRSIGRLSEFLDRRLINAEDVGLQLLEQQLERLRQDAYRQDLEAAPPASAGAESALGDKTERRLRSRAATDQARIETMKTEDAIRYSTVQVNIYQSPQVHRTMVANVKLSPVDRPFFSRAADALRTGGRILTNIFLGLLHLWSVILIGIAAFFIWKKFARKGP